jgi:hypothetical protein
MAGVVSSDWECWRSGSSVVWVWVLDGALIVREWTGCIGAYTGDHVRGGLGDFVGAL